MLTSRNPLSQPITDSFLVGQFKANSKKVGFIQHKPVPDRYKRRQYLLDKINSLSEEHDLRQQSQQVFEIWPYLVESAIVYLKALDKREDPYHDDAAYGVRELTQFFKTFQDFEPLLYGAERELYRDHIIHMFCVFLLGDYLIRKAIGFENIVMGDLKLPIDKMTSKDEKEAMWCIMSLTHDLGYALQEIPRINSTIRPMLEAFGVESIDELSYSFPHRPLHDFLLNLISSDLLKLPGNDERYVTHLQSKYFLKFSETFEKRDHGVISCLVLLKNLVYFLETDFLLDPYKPFSDNEAKQFQIRRDILRPIAGHSCENIYYLTIPRFDFLLTIMDDIHEWGRPRFRDLFDEPQEAEVEIVEFTTKEVHYKINLLPPQTSLSQGQLSKRAHSTHEYFRRKCDKLCRILRSAVNGEARDIKVTLEVADQVDGGTSYKIVHENPQVVKLFENEKSKDWGEFLCA